MQEIVREQDSSPAVERRADELFGAVRSEIYRRTDKMFAGLMAFQWVAGIVVAILVSPTTWAGAESHTHIHVWAAIFLGGAIASLPIALAFALPGKSITRHVIAIAQMLTSGLLIHLTGGRIETHFHYFGSLAFLAFYRDWRVLVSASIVAAAEHIIYCAYFPHVFFGVAAVQPWRWVEHIGWVGFEDFFLIIAIAQSLKDIRGMTDERARLESVTARIEQEVSDRTAELRESGRHLVAAREAALAASRAKSEFLSSMSHEIRTPMNAILGMTQLLEETTLTTDQRKYLEIMTNNGDALLDLINGILDLARIESGRLSLEHAEFNLEDLANQTVETLAIRAHQKGLEMLAHLRPDVPVRLIGDRLRIRQILLNLIGNSVKFTETGQVMLTVEHDRESADPGDLHFSVSDTGIGIAKDKLEEVFASFTQADSSTTRQYGGSGLGLAIARRLVGLMGGRVWVESELGRGSVFHFTAHLQVPSAASAGTGAVPAVILTGTRVLVVDDNSTNRLILREMLSSRGAEVDEAENGPSALERIEHARTSGIPYKLILLDCRMPGMDGFEVAERIRAGAEQRLTVLMLSSDGLKDQLNRVRELHLDAYLVKPVRRADLFAAIGATINPGVGSAADGVEPAQTAARDSMRPGVYNPQPDVPLSILLADDSRDNRLLIRAFLKNTGHRVDEAENGAIAVAKIKTGEYDLVLMDVQMPVMDGLDAMRAVRLWERERGRRRVPILALTASALDDDVRRTIEAGADLHIGKPIRKAVLIAAIKKSTTCPVTLTIERNPNDAAA
ncbi:MAG: hybrid sensor histidine kinase/response regulator [Candidatus Binataceae bacterium]